jgi:hypothetical protein
LVVTILAPLASITSYGVLYWFVFEMMFMVSTIKSMTHNDRMTRDRRIRNIEITLFSLYIGLYTPCTLIAHSLYNFDPQYYFEQINIFRIVQGMRSVVKLPIDFYMIYEFLKSYFYFVQRKKESIDTQVKNAGLISFGGSHYNGKKEL